MKTVIIPSTSNPWVCTINDTKYSYAAGSTQDVPDEVAAIIDAGKAFPTKPPDADKPFSVSVGAEDKVKTVMDATAEPNTKYILGEQTAVAFSLPSTAPIGSSFMVCWENGSTAATLIVTGNVIGLNYEPSANSHSELNFLWDGTHWAALANEIEVA